MKFPSRSYLLINKKSFMEYNPFTGDYSVVEGKNVVILIGNLLPYKKLEDNNRMVLYIGEFYDPDIPKNNNAEVIESIHDSSSTFEEILNKTYSFFGKWLIIEEKNNIIQCMGDAHSTKSIKYHKINVGVSDTASLLAKQFNESTSLDLPTEEPHYQFTKKEYIRTRWWCGDATFYPNILSLLPNHKLEINCNDRTIITANRSIVTRDIKIDNEEQFIEQCYSRSKQLMQGFFKALDNRTTYGLTVTGGYDSRIIFAASHSIYGKNAHYFISRSKDMGEDHPDISIPKEICRQMKCNFSIYNITEDNLTINLIKEYFPDAPVEAYSRHNFIKYLKSIPNNSRIIYGLIPETMSGYYFNRLIKINAEGLADMARHAGSKFAEQKYSEWLEKVKSEDLPLGYSILDLFYWEHRGGRWGAQYVNICDLFQDSLWGFNCREFYDIWLKTPIGIRSFPKRKNLIEIAKRFGEEYISVPYQKPNKWMDKMRSIIEENHVLCLVARQVDYKYRRLKHLFNMKNQKL